MQDTEMTTHDAVDAAIILLRAELNWAVMKKKAKRATFTKSDCASTLILLVSSRSALIAFEAHVTPIAIGNRNS